MRLLIVPAHDVFDAIAATIVRLRSSEVYVGESTSLSADDQARLLGEAWERAEKTEPDVRLVIYHHSGRTAAYHLGAHPPSLTPADLDLIHRLWLDASKAIGPHVHHHDIVRAALIQMEQQLTGPQREDALAAIRQVAATGRRAGGRRRATRLLAAARHGAQPGRRRLAELLTELGVEDQVVVFRVLPRKDAAAVFEYLSLDAQETLLKAMAQEDVASLLNNMAPDDRTMFLEELPAAATRSCSRCSRRRSAPSRVTLLGYPEDSVGRLMTPNYVAVREHWTVREVLDYIRSHGQDSETLNVVYVVDEQGALIDDIRIREFLLTSLDFRVAQSDGPSLRRAQGHRRPEDGGRGVSQARSHGAAGDRHRRDADRDRHDRRRAGRRGSDGDRGHPAHRRIGSPRRAVHADRVREDGPASGPAG